MKRTSRMFKALLAVGLVLVLVSGLAGYAAAQGTWDTTKLDIPTARNGAVSGVIAGQLYVVGGTSPTGTPTTTALEVYDPGTDTWDRTKASAPTSRVAAAGAAINGKLYVTGGCINSDCGSRTTNILEVFDPLAGPFGTWTTLTPMPTARLVMAAGAIGGKLYVAGGGTRICCPALDTLEIFDPLAGPSGTWTAGPSMPTARRSSAGAVIDGKLYVVGGALGFGLPAPPDANAPLSTLEIFDPLDGPSGTWTAGAPMPTPRLSMAAAAIDGRLYVMGGFDGTGFVGTVEVYDPITDTWSTDTSMPTPRQGLVAEVINGKLYAVTGVVTFTDFTNVLEVFTPAVLVADEGCGDASSLGLDINSVEVSSDGTDIEVIMTLCGVVQEGAKYRVHFDFKDGLAIDDDRNNIDGVTPDDFCFTTSDDTMKLARRTLKKTGIENRVTGPGTIVVDTAGGISTLTYTVPYTALDALTSGDDVLIWADAHKKGIQDRAPDTDGTDGCSKPENANEVLTITLA